MNIVEKAILEWSFRCEKGYPDLSNEKDIDLFESLFGFRLDEGILKWNDFSDASRKYYRLGVIDKKIDSKSPFTFKDGKEGILTYADDSYAPLFAGQEVDAIKKIGGARINQFPFFKDEEGNDVSFSALEKTKEFGGSGGSKIATTERQEHSIIDAINAVPGVKTLRGDNGVEVEGVIKAEKAADNNELGTEPYADVILQTRDGELKVSAKGEQAPTLAGGGISGMTTLASNNQDIKNWLVDFYEDAYQFYKDRVEDNNLDGINLAGNKLIPDVSRRIPKELVKTIIQGTPEMGGPIAYYYQGSMDVSFEVNGNTVEFKNGRFTSIDDFIKKHGGVLYAHIRKRDGDFYFTDSMQDINGIILRRIFTKKEGSKSAQSRFGTLDKIRGIEI
ncbi:MAG: hypothetical protein ACO22Y_00050 [Sediminibacterium sp.]